MKVCYVDESGNTAQDPCLVMVGILVDANRLHRTQTEFAETFDEIQELLGKNLRELKGAKMMGGRGGWRHVRPQTRKQIAQYFCDWIERKKHRLIVTAIDRTKLKEIKGAEKADECRDEWLAAGVHVALQIQKTNQGARSNKGRTFLIFDDNKRKMDKFSELFWKPPAWTDGYYCGKKKTGWRALDQIIDAPFAVKSQHAGLVQVADLFAFILRRYVEIEEYDKREEWLGEKEWLDGYVRSLKGRFFPKASRWPERMSSEAAKWFNDLAPSSLRNLE